MGQIVKLIGKSRHHHGFDPSQADRDHSIKTLSLVAILGLQALDEFHVLLLRILRLHILVHDLLPRVSFRLTLPSGTWSVHMSHIHRGSRMQEIAYLEVEHARLLRLLKWRILRRLLEESV